MEDQALKLYIPDWEDINVYGKSVLEKNSLSEVFDLCRKPIVIYQEVFF